MASRGDNRVRQSAVDNAAAAAPAALSTVWQRLRPGVRRAAGALGIALVCMGGAAAMGGLRAPGGLRLVAVGLTVGFVMFGFAAVRIGGLAIARAATPRINAAGASALRMVWSLAGYAIVALGALTVLEVNISGFLVGGAVTAVILGVAAQQVLAGFFAGVVLLFARPFVPGQHITVHSGALGGPFVGTVLHAGLLYTTLRGEDGPVQLPNAGLLAAAIGPAAADPEPPKDDTESVPGSGFGAGSACVR